MRCTSRASSSASRTSSLFRSMVSSGSTKRCGRWSWRHESPHPSCASARRHGTTKRSLRMVTNSSCRMPSSRCAFRKRSSDSWMVSSAARCRGAGGRAPRWRGRRRCHRAESCLPDLFSSARKSPIACARRPSSGKRSAAAVSTLLASAARSSSAKTSEISPRLQAGAFDAQFVYGGVHVGQAAKSTRMAAPRVAGAAPTQPQIVSRFAGLRKVHAAQSCSVGMRLHFASSRRPRGSRHIGPALRAAIRIPELQRWFSCYCLSSRRKAFSITPQRALGDLQGRQIAAPHPFHARHVVARR